MTNAWIQPYLFFGGRCEEAIEFYRQGLGAQIEMLMYHKDSPYHERRVVKFWRNY